MNLPDHFEALANAGHRAAQAGGLTTLASWLVSSEGGVLAGIVIGLAGLGIQLHYRKKQDQREQAEHDRRMERL